MESGKLGITEDTPLEISADGEALIIRPLEHGGKERVRESTKRIESALAQPKASFDGTPVHQGAKSPY